MNDDITYRTHFAAFQVADNTCSADWKIEKKMYHRITNEKREFQNRNILYIHIHWLSFEDLNFWQKQMSTFI